MFGRRKREEEAAAEAAREGERRALFAKLAERPEHVCPFLGLVDERAGYVEGVSDDHRCYAFGDPAPLSAEQQTRVCQERGYGNCPRYLRGVLVIPTEELEALRRPSGAAARAGASAARHSPPTAPRRPSSPAVAPAPHRRWRRSRLPGLWQRPLPGCPGVQHSFADAGPDRRADAERLSRADGQPTPASESGLGDADARTNAVGG